jgi:FkbM family methyltransferase
MRLKAFLKDIKWRYHNLGIQKTDCGTRLKINSFMDHLIFKEIFTDKIYDEFILRTLKKNSKNNEPRRVFDIGANLGFFTIRCCELWNRLGMNADLDFVIYEPSDNCIGRLEENLKVFDQKKFSFDIRNKLVGKKSGWDWFIEDKDNHLGQCVSEEIKSVGKRHTRKVMYYDLSEDLYNYKIDLIKCDIEGSEVEFLKSYTGMLDNVFSIIIETHGNDSKDFACSQLKKNDFVLYDKSELNSNNLFNNLFFIKET